MDRYLPVVLLLDVGEQGRIAEVGLTTRANEVSVDSVASPLPLLPILLRTVHNIDRGSSSLIHQQISHPQSLGFPLGQGELLDFLDVLLFPVLVQLEGL